VSVYRCLDDAIKDQFLFHINREDRGLSLIPWFPYSSLLHSDPNDTLYHFYKVNLLV